jgi:hypothetical protein
MTCRLCTATSPASSAVIGTVHTIATKTIEPFYFQQNGAPPHYHRDIRSYLDEILPVQWIGRRGNAEHHSSFPDLTSFDSYLWGSLRDAVYCRKPSTLEKSRKEIEKPCAAIPVDTLAAVANALVRRTRKCLQANGGTLNTCSSSTCFAAIPFYVHKIWIINELFKQIYCMVKCV